MSIENHGIFEYESGFISSIGEQLYLNEKWADFYFVFESDDGICERLPVHKAHLAASNVFETMFNGTWIEENEAKIGDASVGAFKEFLQFFYLARVKLTRENVADVMNLGNMYNVTECVKACETFMINTMTNVNVCWVYPFAIFFERKDLKKYCEAIISMNTKAVIKSDAFLQFNRKTLHQILRMDSLHCTEAELFAACLEWVKSTSKQNRLTTEILKEHLGDALYDIRFGLMSIQEFVAIDFSNEIFTFDEYREIVQIFASEEYEPKIFSKNRPKRFEMISWAKESTIKWDRKVSLFRSSKPYFIKGVEIVMFSTNKPILLRALNCEDLSLYKENLYKYLEIDVPSEITIVEISRNTGEEVTLYNAQVTLLTDEETSIIISDPILIRPRFTYQVQMRQSPPENCCTALLLKSAMKPKSDITIEFHNNPIIEGDKRGLIIGMEIIPL